MPKSKLTPKQLLFCKYYLIDFNSAEAARKAGYSQKTARTIGSKLLTKIDIQIELAKGIGKLEEKAVIDQQYVLNELIENVEMAKGRKDVKVLTKMGLYEGEVVSLKDANAALNLIGQHFGMFKQIIEDDREKQADHKKTLEEIKQMTSVKKPK